MPRERDFDWRYEGGCTVKGERESETIMMLPSYGQMLIDY